MDMQIKTGQEASVVALADPLGPRHQRTVLGVRMTENHRTNAPKKCAIEGCDTRTLGRRCDDHQAQLERNLATLAGGEQ